MHLVTNQQHVAHSLGVGQLFRTKR